MPFGLDYLPIIQVCLLPFVVVVLWRVRLAGQRIPKAVLLLGAILGLVGFSIGFSTRSLGPKRVVITRFSDDPIGAKSRIFREQIEKRLSSVSSQRVMRSPNSFSTFREVRRRFGDLKNYDAIVWGKQDAFLIYFPVQGEPAEDAQNDSAFMGLRLVTQPPSIVLSRSEQSGTLDFVADVLGALKVGADRDPLAESRREILLKSALKIESRWRSRAHRALPAWLLGNSALERAFDAGPVEEAELVCALNYFATASGMFRTDDNPELAASVYNNWGVALALHGWYTGNQDSLVSARKQFQRAFATRTMPNTTGFPLRAWQLARANLLLLSGKRKDRMQSPKRERKQHHETGKKESSRKRKL